MGRKNILNEARSQDDTNSGPSEDRDHSQSEDEEKSQETRKWTHRAPEWLVEEIDEYTEEQHFPSRKFTINHILRKHLEEER